MNGRYEVGDIVLGKWTLMRLIGQGSYGKVFEAKRKDFGGEYDAAIKIIVIPQTQEEVNEILSEGMTEESVSEYFRNFVEEISKEFALMAKIKGDSNIVSYEDHEVVPHTDGIGWDIIIRMELLTPFSAILKTEALTREDIINLGMDICRALELCQKHHIIHRDIKPDNIFRSDNGHYKLGDFGVARTVDKTMGGLSKKGTYNYMAPEVYREEPYGATVDIYSLGIVLYRLLNDNRIPFLPPVSKVIRHTDREAALSRRMSGEQLPYPANDQGRLAEITLKACAYDPKNRYPDPRAMREDLEALLEAEKTAPHPAEEDATVYNGVRNFHRSAGTDSSTGSASSAKPVPEKQIESIEIPTEETKADSNPEIIAEPAGGKGGAKRILAIIGVLAMLIVAGFGVFAYLNGQRNKPQEPIYSPLQLPVTSATPIPTSASTAVAPTATPIPTPTTTPTPTPTPEPTVSPTPVPTATPTPKPTVTPTSTLKPIPEILSVELDENNNPVLSWQPMENANLYYIYQTEDYGADKQLVTTKNTNYTIKSCKVGHKYGFRIKARFLDGTYSLLSEYEYINYAEISSIKLHKENLSLEAYLVVRVGTPVTLTAEAYGEENNGNVPLSNAKFEWKLADSNIQSIRVGSKDNSQCTIEALTPHPEGVDIIVSCNGYEKVLTVYSFESLNEDYSKIQLEETNIRFLNSDLEEAIRKYLGKSSDEALHTMDLKAVSSVKLQGESIVVNEEYYGDAVYKIGPAHENAEGPYGDNWLPFYMSDLARLPNLFYAEIAGRTLYESVTLSQCDKLQRLDIAFCAGVDVDVCTRCKALTELYIHCCRGIIINDVNKDSRINKIQLSRCDYDFLDGFNRLSFIKTLNTLYISTYFNPEKGSHRIYHTTLSFIEPFVQIKDLWVADALYLNNCAILGKLTALEHLHLNDFGAMTLYLKNKATGYEALSNLTQLKELDVGGAAYLNNLSFASEMTKLEKLDIRGTDISDLSPIAELPLKELKVSSPLLDSAKSLFPNANVIAVD